MTWTNYAQMLEHLVTMASAPGWKEYAWQRAKELDADVSGLWAGIAADLVAKMKVKTTEGAKCAME